MEGDIIQNKNVQNNLNEKLQQDTNLINNISIKANNIPGCLSSSTTSRKHTIKNEYMSISNYAIIPPTGPKESTDLKPVTESKKLTRGSH